jgi:hypothetical protein
MALHLAAKAATDANSQLILQDLSFGLISEKRKNLGQFSP